MSGSEARPEFTVSTRETGAPLSLRPGTGCINCYAMLSDGSERWIARITGHLSVGNDELSWRSAPDATGAANAPDPANGTNGGRLTATGAGLHASLVVAPSDDDTLKLGLRIKRTVSKLYPHADQNARSAPQLRRCGIRVDFLPGGESFPQLADCHVPHLVPRPGLVMADMVFRSPAIVIRSGEEAAPDGSAFGAALAPDLKELTRHRPAPWALDFEREGPFGTPRLALEMVHQEVDHHVYFRAVPKRAIAIPDEGIGLAGELILTAAADEDFVRKVQGRLRKVSTHLRQPWSDISEHSRARYG